MARKDRFNGAVESFGSQSLSTERTVFGDNTQSNDIDDNLNADFLRGWGIVGVNDLPTKQDFNACAYTLGYLIAYLYQQGVAEWNALQDYHTNQLVNVGGLLYKSIQDDNVGHDPTSSPLWWSVSGATGDMLKSENLSGLANYSTARDNLGILGVKGTSIASAATTNIGNAGSHFVDITGTTTITSLGTGTARNFMMVNFTGALTLTHNATSLILPGAANITTAAGDTAIFVRNDSSGSANWRCIAYQRASGLPIVTPPSAGRVVKRTVVEDGTKVATTGTIPSDNTDPLSTEGDQLVSSAHTPLATGNILKVTVTVHGSPQNNVQGTVALFRGSTLMKCAGIGIYRNSTLSTGVTTFTAYYTAPNTSAITFSIRAGASSGAMVVNGDSNNAALYNGNCKTTLEIEEYSI